VLEPILPPAAQRRGLDRAAVGARPPAEAGYRVGCGGPLSAGAPAEPAPLRPTVH
jgi:hypothetical protein